MKREAVVSEQELSSPEGLPIHLKPLFCVTAQIYLACLTIHLKHHCQRGSQYIEKLIQVVMSYEIF